MIRRVTGILLRVASSSAGIIKGSSCAQRFHGHCREQWHYLTGTFGRPLLYAYLRVCCCCVHVNCQIKESVVRQRCWSVISKKIRETTKTKFGWEARRFPHETKAHTCNEINVQPALTCPQVSAQLQHGDPRVPTTNLLVAAEHSGCCFECCLHRTKRTVVMNTKRNAPAVWGTVRVRLADMG